MTGRPDDNQPKTVATYANREDARQAVDDLRAEGYTEVDVIEVSETQFEVTVLGDAPPDVHDDVTPTSAG